MFGDEWCVMRCVLFCDSVWYVSYALSYVRDIYVSSGVCGIGVIYRGANVRGDIAV